MKEIAFDENITDVDKSILENDDSVFHYTKYEKAIEFILKEKEIKFSRLKTTNDPLEYSQRIFGAGHIDEITEGNTFNLLKYRHAINQALEFKTYFISTIQNKKSKKAIELGFNNLRMWSQYGEDHKGICLILSKEKLINEINKIDENELYGKYFKRINYNASTINSKNFINFTDSDFNLSTDKYVERYFKKFYRIHFFTKSSDYHDENEFRFVIITKKNISNNIPISIKNALVGIVLGDKFNQVYLPSLKALIEDIPIYSLKWFLSQFYCKRIF